MCSKIAISRFQMNTYCLSFQPFTFRLTLLEFPNGDGKYHFLHLEKRLGSMLTFGSHCCRDTLRATEVNDINSELDVSGKYNRPKF